MFFLYPGETLRRLSSEQTGNWSDSLHLQLHGDTLIVPRFDGKEVSFYAVK